MQSWPDLNVAGWSGTKRSLHLYSQMLGKMRVALSPTQPNWMHTALYLNARGVTTGFIPHGHRSFEAVLDVFDSTIAIADSNGERRVVNLIPAQTIAEIYGRLNNALRELSIGCSISAIPQELPDTTPFNEDHRASEYDPAAVQRWFQVMTDVATIFEAWRSQFFGRTGIQLWWGAFDLAVMLFSGRKVAAPTDRGFLMKYDLDAELMNVGLYLGDESNAPFFYGYIYPEPPNAPSLSVAAPASWSTTLREWVLPYEAVRKNDDPGKVICAFIDSIYNQCFAACGWTRDNHQYIRPKTKRGS